MVMIIMIIMITIVVLMYQIIMKNSREEDKTFPLCGEKNSGDGYEDNDYIDFNDNNCSNNA